MEDNDAVSEPTARRSTVATAEATPSGNAHSTRWSARQMDDGNDRNSRWLLALWIPIGVVLASLFAVSTWLLVTTVFGLHSLGADQAKNVWAFLGAAIGALVTLIATLLTAQNQRAQKVAAVEQDRAKNEAEKQERRLKEQAERRLQMDTVGRMLEYLVDDSGAFASSAVVAGAISTMMEVGGGTPGIRVLRELWLEDAVPSATAVAIINQILQSAEQQRVIGAAGQDNSLQRPIGDSEVVAVAELLAVNAEKLLPGLGQMWVGWPSIFLDEKGDSHWPTVLPLSAKNALLVFLALMFISRDVSWWQKMEANTPMYTLHLALDDDQVSALAATLLVALVQAKVVVGETQASQWGDTLEKEPRIWKLAQKLGEPEPWFAEVLWRLDGWASTGHDPGIRTPEPIVDRRGQRRSRAFSHMRQKVSSRGGATNKGLKLKGTLRKEVRQQGQGGSSKPSDP